MNILLFSQLALDDTNSYGNTITNFFDGTEWENDNFFHIYMRNTIPKNRFCKNYYRITLIDMIKNYLSKEKIGQKLDYNDFEINNTDLKNEKKLINLIHNHSLNFVYTIADYMYWKKKWLNNKFIKYINDINPDIFFAFLTDVSMLYPIIDYLKYNTNSKIVLFACDDIYGSYKSKNRIEKRKLEKEFSKCVEKSDFLYGISEELCDKYTKLFDKKFFVLHKGCDLSKCFIKKNNKVIKFTYAGNLLYGRDDILASIARAIDKSNKYNEKKAFLEIYSDINVSKKISRKLNIMNSSKIMGIRNYNEIKRIMDISDYNLVIESFDSKQIEKVKYSFSSKITDCIQSNGLIIGIGPSSVSTIKYIKKVPGAITIDDVNQIDDKIREIINTNDVHINVLKQRKFALENLEIKKNQNKIRNDFKNIMKN